MIENLTIDTDRIALLDAARQSIAACDGLDLAAQRRRLEEDGLIGMMTAGDGLGLGVQDAWLVAEAAGAALLAFALAEAIVARAVGGGGESIACLAALTGDGDAGACRLSGVAGRLTAATPRDEAIVIDLDAGVFRPDALGDVATVAAHTIDTGRLDCAIRLDRTPVVRLGESDRAHWATAVLRTLRAADSLGAASVSHAETCGHVSTRRQFGKPLSALQTVSTALAEDHLRLESARLSIAYAALAIDEGRDDLEDAVDAAVALSGEPLIRVAENAIQLHGAMGFTTELPLHRRLRRILAAADLDRRDTAYARLAERFIRRARAA